MYQITKLPMRSQALIADISSQNKSRSLPVTIALSRIIANNLPLPTTEVEDIINFYNIQHRLDVQTDVAMLNELFILDVDAVLDYIVKFYTYRYNQVFSCNHVLLRKDTAVMDFFKISKTFDDVSLKCIEENYVYITDLTTRFIELLEALKEN